MKSILDVVMRCRLCRHECRLGEAVPCANDGTGYGCPIEDCGGAMYDRDGAITEADVVRVG